MVLSLASVFPHATFEMGTPLEEVQERLGHTDIKTTMNIYTHVTEK